jgi:hypothetical protein
MYNLEDLPPMCLLHGNVAELSPFLQRVELAEELDNRGLPYRFAAARGCRTILRRQRTMLRRSGCFSIRWISWAGFWKAGETRFDCRAFYGRLCDRRCLIDRTRVTVRVLRDLLEGAKRYADEQGTTLTRLVSELDHSKCTRLRSRATVATPAGRTSGIAVASLSS